MLNKISLCLKWLLIRFQNNHRLRGSVQNEEINDNKDKNHLNNLKQNQSSLQWTAPNLNKNKKSCLKQKDKALWVWTKESYRWSISNEMISMCHWSNKSLIEAVFRKSNRWDYQVLVLLEINLSFLMSTLAIKLKRHKYRANLQFNNKSKQFKTNKDHSHITQPLKTLIYSSQWPQPNALNTSATVS